MSFVEDVVASLQAGMAEHLAAGDHVEGDAAEAVGDADANSAHAFFPRVFQWCPKTLKWWLQRTRLSAMPRMAANARRSTWEPGRNAIRTRNDDRAAHAGESQSKRWDRDRTKNRLLREYATCTARQSLACSSRPWAFGIFLQANWFAVTVWLNVYECFFITNERAVLQPPTLSEQERTVINQCRRIRYWPVPSLGWGTVRMELYLLVMLLIMAVIAVSLGINPVFSAGWAIAWAGKWAVSLFLAIVVAWAASVIQRMAVLIDKLGRYVETQELIKQSREPQ